MADQTLETQARSAAKEQWSKNTCGVSLAEADEGTPEFFAQMTDTRYDWQPWHPALLSSFAPTGRLLEIGCGAGTDHAELARSASPTIGIDLAWRGANLTTTRLALEGRPGQALVADGEGMPFPDRSFDSVYSFGVIHHTDHPARVAAEMARVMKPGARFLVALYHRHSVFAAEKVMAYLVRGRRQGLGWRQFLAEVEFGATDLTDRPQVLLYSRRDARALFPAPAFTGVRTTVVHPAVRGRIIDTPMTRPFGWYVVVTGQRA